MDFLYGNPKSPLHFQKPHEFAIAVILSAQCTDERVNQVTPVLFQELDSLEKIANVKLSKLEKLIYSTGFYKNKSKNIKAFAKIILEKYDGKLPRTLEELEALPGIGRKTANVVLSELYGIESGVVVDTHVRRLSNRLGFVETENVLHIEEKLKTIVPQKDWRKFSLQLIFHGRRMCMARNPNCSACELQKLCPSFPIQ